MLKDLWTNIWILMWLTYFLQYHVQIIYTDIGNIYTLPIQSFSITLLNVPPSPMKQISPNYVSSNEEYESSAE